MKISDARRVLVIPASILLLAACGLPVPVTPCQDDDACPDGYSCSPAHGYCVDPGPGLVDGAVTDGAMADGAISDGAISDGAISDGAISDGAMTDGAMADGAMADGAMADGAMTDGAMTDGAVTDSFAVDHFGLELDLFEGGVQEAATLDVAISDTGYKDALVGLPDRFRSDIAIVRFDTPLFLDLQYNLDRRVPWVDALIDCGAAGLPCCYGMECDQWSTCGAPGQPDGICYACGEAEGDCCPDGSCQFGNTCSGQRCRTACGSAGQPCCDDSSCDENLYCCDHPPQSSTCDPDVCPI